MHRYATDVAAKGRDSLEQDGSRINGTADKPSTQPHSSEAIENEWLDLPFF